MAFKDKMSFFKNLFQKPTIPIMTKSEDFEEAISFIPNLSITQIEKEILKLGTLKVHSAQWISPMVNHALREGFGVNPIALSIRKSGELLSKEEVKALGLRGNVLIGRTFLDSLTEQGKLNPVEAAYTLAFCLSKTALHNNNLNIAAQNIKVTGIKIGMRFCSGKDQRSCQKALNCDGVIFEIDQCPSLPLDQCDADLCRCWYTQTALN